MKVDTHRGGDEDEDEDEDEDGDGVFPGGEREYLAHFSLKADKLLTS